MAWPTKKLGEVLEKVPRIPGVLTKDYLDEGQYPIIDQGQSVIAGYTNDTTSVYAGEVPVIIFGDHTRAVKFVDFSFAIGADGTKILKPTSEFDPKFFYYFLQSIDIPARGYARHFSLLREFEIPIPSIVEQKKIVAKIEKQFTKIDEAARLRAESEGATAALLPAALHEIFSSAESKGWCEKTLPDISQNLDFKRKPITRLDREDGQYPYYGASGIVDQVSGYIFDEDILLVSEDGANLLARSTPIAFSVSGKVWVNNHAHVLKFDDPVTQKLVEYFLNTFDLRPYISGSAQPKLNQGKMNKIKIPLPPLAEQKEIVKKLDVLSEKVRALQALQSAQSADLKALKQSILHEAFSGGL